MSFLSTVPAYAAQLDTTWLGGAGTWNDPLKWSNGVPNNGVNTFNAFIDNGNAVASSVHINANARIDNLELDAGDEVWVDNGQQFFLVGGASAGGIANSGTIRLNSTGSSTYIRPSGGVVTFSGAGTLQFSDSSSNWIYQENGGSLVNAASHTIRGAGNFGWGGTSTSLTNHGLVLAEFPANTLRVDGGNAVFTNSGTLRADNGATLTLQGNAGYDNSGTINAQNASFVNITTSVRGGTFSTAGTGAIQALSGAILDASTTPISNTGLLQSPNGQQPRAVGTINNSGTILINSTGASTYLQPLSGVLTLNGAGTLQLNDSANNWIYQVNGGSLVNSATHTIRGAGKLGWGVSSTAITNQGTVIAEFPANGLIADPGNEVFTNTGTLRAQNGATLTLQGGGGFTNVGGTINAQNASVVNIGNTTIRGGTLSTAGTGVIQALSSATLDGSTTAISNTGLLESPNGQQPGAVGTINNSGTIRITSTASGTYLHPKGGVLTLSGTGTLQMNDSPNNWIYQTGGGSLVNSATHTIRGAGHFGWGGVVTAITNQGTVIAEFPANALIVDSSSAVFTNTGTLRAQSGATLTLQGSGGFTNVGGTINAQNASFVNIGSTTIRGGTLSTAGTGVIHGLDNGVLDGTTNTINNTGLLRVPNGHQFRARGTVNNTGIFEVATATFSTYLHPSGGDLTLTGAGTLKMADSPNTWIYQNGGGGLINGAGHTIRGAGRLGWTGAATSVNNQGTIIADGVNTLSIEASPFTTSGSVVVNAGSAINRPNGDFTQTAGSTKVNGTLSASGFVDILGGSLGGAGAVSKTKIAGVVAPGDPAAIPTGTLTINGTYNQSASGAYNLELAGNATGLSDKLTVTGAATLDGTLNIQLINGYSPAPGEKFTIMTYASHTGEFATINGQTISATLSWFIKYSDNDVRIAARAGCGGTFSCDSDCNGTVNAFDINNFLTLLANNGAGGCSPCAGDTNGNGTVNTFDINAFIACIAP